MHACADTQAKLYPRVLAAMKPGATLGLSHGFLLGVMQNDGVDFRPDINVVLNAPKVHPFSSCPATAAPGTSAHAVCHAHGSEGPPAVKPGLGRPRAGCRSMSSA